jgi:hypothetical protein
VAWNPRLYLLIVCVGVLARAAYRGALEGLDGDVGGWAGFVTFWIPLIALLFIGSSLLAPVVRRWIRRR